MGLMKKLICKFKGHEWVFAITYPEHVDMEMSKCRKCDTPAFKKFTREEIIKNVVEKLPYQNKELHQSKK
jgi:hypothetical protein